MYVDLSVLPEDKHFESMRFCAERITDNKTPIEIVRQERRPKTFIAKFSMPKARQMDVVDDITQVFADFVADSINFGVDFPRSAAEERKAKKANERAKAKRREMAEIRAQAKAARSDADPHTVGLVFKGKRRNLSKRCLTVFLNAVFSWTNGWRISTNRFSTPMTPRRRMRIRKPGAGTMAPNTPKTLSIFNGACWKMSFTSRLACVLT